MLHGAALLLLQDENGQIMETHSISPGLIIRGWGRSTASCTIRTRRIHVAVDDRQTLEGFQLLCRTEGIMPALESSHAVYYATELAKTLEKDKIVVINLSGRGDKDIDIVVNALGGVR